MADVKTYVIVTDNVQDVTIDSGVKCVKCLFTDKAVYPINAMGIAKAVEEKSAVAKSLLSGGTKICCTRYSNVMCGSESVILVGIEQIRKGNPFTLTGPRLTCFVLVQKDPACTIQTQAEAMVEFYKYQFHQALKRLTLN